MTAMGAAGDEISSWLWTRSQRRFLIALVLVLCAVFTGRYLFNRAYVNDPQPVRGPRYDEVVDKVDPNVSDVAALSALPLIGERRAQDIIDFREASRAERPGEIVFAKMEDLLKIRGFGRASVETLKPYLMFPPTTQSATQP